MVEERIQRRLAAILAADVVGYSRVMGEDEEATLATLRAYRNVIDGLIEHHGGRVFGSAGDSVIANLPGPVEAVRYATEIQLDPDKRNADLPEPHRMRFRIGVHLGDVMVEGDNLMCDGVNVAAFGEHRVTNIGRPVQVYRVPLASEVRTKSPFRGLEVFQLEHADIFYGRSGAIAAPRQRLEQRAAAGTAFLLINGMTGPSKSSLLRAGLLPAITGSGAVEGVEQSTARQKVPMRRRGAECLVVVMRAL